MAITAASTALSTGWSEFSTVAFAAGTLADIDSCVAEVESKLQRGILSATTVPTISQVYNWLIRAKQELAEKKNFTWKRRYATATTTASTFRYSLPPDYAGGHMSLRDMGYDNLIPIVDNNQFDTLYPDVSEEQPGQIKIATIKNMEIWIAPPADGVVLELEYGRSGSDATPIDFSWLPEIERFRCCDFAIAEAFESLHQYQVADRFSTKWGAGLRNSIKADGKKKWAGMGFRCRSVFQAK
jgi:hypothetical protein